MKRLIGLFFICILFSAGFSSADASTINRSPATEKKVIALTPLIDHSGYKKDMFEDIRTKTNTIFSSVPNSGILSNDTIAQGLISSTGTSDIMLIEKVDLAKYCKENKIDFLVLQEMIPITMINSKGWTEKNYATVSLKIKVYDSKNDKYLYFNTITEQGRQSGSGGWAGAPSTTGPVRKAVDMIVKRLDTELTSTIKQMSE